MPSIDHDDAVLKTCRRCGIKCANCRVFNLTSSLRELYEKHFGDSGIYDDCLHAGCYPTVICGACNSCITRAEKSGKPASTSIQPYDWGEPKKCVDRTCSVCTIWKSRAQNVVHSESASALHPNHLNNVPPSAIQSELICSSCFSSPGNRHVCKLSKIDAATNALSLIKTARLDEILLHRLARDAIGTPKGSAVISKGGGASVRISLGDVSESPTPALELPDWKKIRRSGTGLSGRQLLSVHRAIPAAATSTSFRSIIRDRASFDAYFTSRQFELERGAKRSAEKYQGWIAYCISPLHLLERLRPGIDCTTARLKMCIDFGKGFLKVTIQCVDDPARANSVDHLLILVVTDAIENYHNLKVIFELEPIRTMIFVCKNLQVVGDFKILCIILGIMLGRCPCIWCAWDSRQRLSASAAEPRTEARRREMLERLATLFGNRPDRVKDCEGYERPALFDSEFLLRAAMLWLFPPPGLHLMLGIFSKIYEALIAALDEIERAAHDDALRALFIRKSCYFGGKFEGNSTRKILKNLEAAGLKPAESNGRAMQLYELLSSFNDVVTSCFGLTRTENFEDYIESFKKRYDESGLSETLKVHALLDHVVFYLTNYEQAGAGLALASEQAIEMSHSAFWRKWKRRLAAPDSPTYGLRILGALADFNYDVVDVNTTTPVVQ